MTLIIDFRNIKMLMVFYVNNVAKHYARDEIPIVCFKLALNLLLTAIDN